ADIETITRWIAVLAHESAAHERREDPVQRRARQPRALLDFADRKGVPVGCEAFEHVDGPIDGAHILGFVAHLVGFIAAALGLTRRSAQPSLLLRLIVRLADFYQL